MAQTPLFKGWNFIAFTPEMTKKTFNEIRGSCTIEDIYVWNYPEQEWADDYSPKKRSSSVLDKSIDRDLNGYGFVIKVSSDCKLNGNGGSEIPKLPSVPN